MKKICFVTGNKGKFLEAKEKFSSIGVKVVQKNVGYPEIQAETLEEVACFGIDYIKKKVDEPFILEDAGLFIDCLNGFPGVYSSFVFHTIGCEGVLKLLEDREDRKAVFRSVFAYQEEDEEPVFFRGECPGFISKKLLGDHGFGYDPIFIPENDSMTFGQMKTEEKNCFSHRGKALNKLIDFFKEC